MSSSTHMETVKIRACLCSIVTICLTSAAFAAMDPSFELDPASLRDSSASHNVSVTSGKRTEKKRVVKPKTGDAPLREHTVRVGDNLFKILMRDGGMTNAEAEASIEETLHVNNISDIRHLSVGQKILIPQLRSRKEVHSKAVQRVNERLSRNVFDATSTQTLRLAAPAADVMNDPELPRKVSKMWNKLVPSPEGEQKPLSFQSATFSLSLDPARFPVYRAMDGARIVVDQHGSIPPLVKSLIAEKDPMVRIVSGSPLNGRRFLSDLLGVAGFYSVEEDFKLEFGTDPKLKVRSDFKIERTPESLIKQEVVLLNSNEHALPQPLAAFLNKEGFTTYEPFVVSAGSHSQPARGGIRQISAVSRSEIVDAILNAFAVTPRADHRVDVFAADDNGISLSVKAERYFERDGKRYVIAGFDGDPVAYTLFRILETKGYRVVILDGKDDFRSASAKLLAALQVSGNYAQHMVVPDNGSNYSLQLSGFRLKGPGVPGGSLFLTNRPLDKIVRELLTENGYDVQVK